jgi:hypothetical protein
MTTVTVLCLPHLFQKGFSTFACWIDHLGNTSTRNSAKTSNHITFCLSLSVLWIRIRDPVPFCPLDPGSGMGKTWSGSGTNNPDHISDSLMRIRDPGWKKFRSGIRDEHPGSATLNFLNTKRRSFLKTWLKETDSWALDPISMMIGCGCRAPHPVLDPSSRKFEPGWLGSWFFTPSRIQGSKRHRILGPGFATLPSPL